MPRRPPPPPAIDYERRISRLEGDLYMARTAIIGMVASKHLRDVLTAEIYCDTLEDKRAWAAWALQHFMAAAEPGPMEPWSNRTRAFCPLCREGTGYCEGFSMPVGLERHLAGSHRQRQCIAFAAAWQLCTERLIEERDRSRPQLRRSPRADGWLPPWKRPDRQPLQEPESIAIVVDLAARRGSSPPMAGDA